MCREQVSKGWNRVFQRTMAAAMAACMVFAGCCLSAATAQTVAASEVDEAQFYTGSSGINVTAGDSVSYSLYWYGSEETDVTLTIDDIPDGFTGYFKSGSYEVTRVHVEPESRDAIATFYLTVPSDAEDGTYDIVLLAQSTDGEKQTLELELNITGLESGDSNFVVEYPEQEGTTGTTFSYSTTIANNTLSTQTYNFSYNAPTDWVVSFTSDSTQISSIEIESGSSASVTITVTPPDTVEAGEYEIDCAATSSKESLSTELSVTILGTYGLEMTTTDGMLSFDAYSDQASEVSLKITNTGNIDLENVELSYSAPTNWTVTFDETIIDTLEAGASTEVKAYVTPSSNSLNGDYVTYIYVSSDTKSDTLEFRVTVKTQTTWGIVAIVIILVVIVVLVAVRKKYGRR